MLSTIVVFLVEQAVVAVVAASLATSKKHSVSLELPRIFLKLTFGHLDTETCRLPDNNCPPSPKIDITFF